MRRKMEDELKSLDLENLPNANRVLGRFFSDILFLINKKDYASAHIILDVVANFISTNRKELYYDESSVNKRRGFLMVEKLLQKSIIEMRNK